jgi:hypothetical protein
MSKNAVHSLTIFADAQTDIRCGFDEVRDPSEWPFTLRLDEDVVIFLNQAALTNLRAELNATHDQASEVSV